MVYVRIRAQSILAIALALLPAFACLRAQQPDRPRPAVRPEIVCQGTYRSHIQGIASDRKSVLYWSFTRNLVKTDLAGRVLKSAAVPSHHGDLTYVSGKLYVAWSNYFNRPGANSKVYVYDADDLSRLAVKSIPEVTYGAGGMEHHKGHFFVVGGLPDDGERNFVYEYDGEFKFVQRHALAGGHTRLGIQAVGYWEGCWWFGCYGNALLKTDESFRLLAKYPASFPYGIVGWDAGLYLVGFHFGKSKNACRGKARLARADEQRGLVLETGPGRQ